MDAVYFVLGVLLLALVLWDLFQSIVVPRPSPGWFRIGRYLIRSSWRLVRAIGQGRDGRRHETLLGLFAPAVTIVLLMVWLATLMVGYGLILYAVRDQLRPVPQDLGSAIYFAATSVLTLGFGDVVAAGSFARVVAILAAATGLGAVALVVTFFFSLYGSYQRREVKVVTLQAAAGAPPSAVALLETYGRLGLTGRLPDLFLEWEAWAAEVLDTHVAYPILGYFRSSHDNLTWIGAFGSVMDAAGLVLTSIDGCPTGEAELFRRVGAHLVEDLSNLGFLAGIGAAVAATERLDLDRAGFAAACARLSAAGYALVPFEQAWPAFQAARASYAPGLERMATYWAARSTSWLGTDEAPQSAAHRTTGGPA